MSAKYTFLAWDTPIDNAPLKLALLQLANNADDDGFSYYSISKMAKACGMSDRTFMRKIAELEKMKVLSVERRANRPSLYTLIGDEMGVTLCHLHNAEVTESHGRVTESHRVSDSVSHDPNNTPERESKSIYNDAFEHFWSNKKLPNIAKIKAKTAFKKALPKNTEPMEFAKMLVEDTEIRSNGLQLGFDKMHPTTYLNQARWEDDKPVDVKADYQYVLTAFNNAMEQTQVPPAEAMTENRIIALKRLYASTNLTQDNITNYFIHVSTSPAFAWERGETGSAPVDLSYFLTEQAYNKARER